MNMEDKEAGETSWGYLLIFSLGPTSFCFLFYKLLKLVCDPGQAQAKDKSANDEVDFLTCKLEENYHV
jgi:hypothetical protein